MPPGDPGEAAVIALSSRYEALKGAVFAVFKTAGGEPGDTPEKAVLRAIKAAKVATLKIAIDKVKDEIVEAQRSRIGLPSSSEGPEASFSRGYTIGWGDGLANLLEALESMLQKMDDSNE